MAAKKNYSRYFIILQEDEKGFSSDASKFPTGYAKIEKKSEKCRVSYYVQNLKKDKEPYYMILICDKKNEKNLIKLGEMNIDDYGRAEISYEYDINNIANSGMSMDKIKGAAVVNFQDSNMKSVLTGFISGVRLNDWKNYYMIQNKVQSRQDTSDNVETNEVIVEDKTVKTASTNLDHESENLQHESKKVKENKVKDKKVKEERVENNNRKLEEMDDVNKNKSEDNVFDKYENDIEQYKNINDDTSEDNDRSDDINDKSNDINDRTEDINDRTEDINDRTQNINDRLDDINDSVDSENSESNNDDIDNDDIDNDKIDEVIDNTSKAEEYRGEEVRDKHKDKYGCKCKEKYECKCKKDEQDYPIGVQGEFFKNLAKGLEEVSGVCPEVGKCKWYKVPVESLQDINKTTDLNKYTVVYYPMICYYPYIKKYGHYLLGYKCDSKGKMRYLVYAIPGTKVMHDQPFGGTTGFATWVCKDYREDNMYSTGYWVMFYDFKNSRIMVPVI